MVAASLALVACTPSNVPGPEPTGVPTSPPATAASGKTFTFGMAADPDGLDPALTSDTETYRVSRQILEGLVGVDPETSAPQPMLATSWQVLNEGRAYLFNLRRNVTFHDGRPFNSAAVCANFERWFRLPPDVRADRPDLPFQAVFRAFADTPGNSIYRNCAELGPYRVQINLTSRFSAFIPSLALPAFAMASPQSSPRPVGTGPFTFRSWNRSASGDRLVLEAAEDYWGDKGKVDRVVFRTIRHPDSRRRALEKGDIDAYDLVTVSNVTPLARKGLPVLQRDPYSVLYLGMNLAYPAMDDIRLRQAAAHAIDRDALLDNLFLNGSRTTSQFVPPKLGVNSDDAEEYPYDPAKAKELLEESDYRGQPLPFYYPLGVTRPYLPSPEKVYAELSRQLTAVGFRIKPVPVPWSEGYVQEVQRPGVRAFHLMGLSGSYQDPDNFIGSLFGTNRAEFALADGQLLSKVNRARGLPDGPERTEAYRDINTLVSKRIPGVPLAFPISAVALSARVQSYPVSPVLDEVFNRVALTDQGTD